jgi:hypothetical protein
MRRLAISVQFAVTVAAAWLVFTRIDWGHLAGLLARAEPMLLTLAGLIVALQFAALVWRWRTVTEMLGGVTVASATLAIGLGRSMLIGQPLLSTVGGDVVRTLILSNETGLALAARSVIWDRVVGFIVLLVLVAVMLPCLAFFVEGKAAFGALAGVSLGGLTVFFSLLAHSQWLRHLPWIGRRTAFVAADLGQIFGKAGRSYRVLLLSLAIHLMAVVLIYALAHAMATQISFFQCLVIVPPAMLISAMPVSLGGWGVREGALAAGFALVGSSSEAGVATSILFGLATPLVGIVTELAAPLARMRAAPPKDAT